MSANQSSHVNGNIQDLTSHVAKPMFEIFGIFAKIVAAHLPSRISAGSPITEELIMGIILQNFPSLQVHASNTPARNRVGPPVSAKTTVSSVDPNSLKLVRGFENAKASIKLYYPTVSGVCIRRPSRGQRKYSQCCAKVDLKSTEPILRIFCKAHTKPATQIKQFQQLMNVYSNNIDQFLNDCDTFCGGNNSAVSSSSSSSSNSSSSNDSVNITPFPDPSCQDQSKTFLLTEEGSILMTTRGTVLGKLVDPKTGNLSKLNDQERQYWTQRGAAEFKDGLATHYSQFNWDGSLKQQAQNIITQNAAPPKAAIPQQLNNSAQIPNVGQTQQAQIPNVGQTQQAQIPSVGQAQIPNVGQAQQVQIPNVTQQAQIPSVGQVQQSQVPNVTQQAQIPSVGQVQQVQQVKQAQIPDVVQNSNNFAQVPTIPQIKNMGQAQPPQIHNQSSIPIIANPVK